jgi:AcrR family transcriptional regulator
MSPSRPSREKKAGPHDKAREASPAGPVQETHPDPARVGRSDPARAAETTDREKIGLPRANPANTASGGQPHTSRTAASRPDGAPQPDPAPSAAPALRAPSPPSANPPSRTRAEKSAARREAILAAAFDEFTERGFAATRIDDIARRAGVGKGTIYLHFRDKEALFQQLVIAMLGPLIADIEKIPDNNLPIRTVMGRLSALFAREIYGTKRREVLRLMMAEGPRFPHLAEFYYRNVVERALAVLRALLDRAHARGELPDDRLSRFPQLVMAPALVAVIWSGLFDRFAPLDMVALMRAHLDVLFGPEGEP